MSWVNDARDSGIKNAQKRHDSLVDARLAYERSQVELLDSCRAVNVAGVELLMENLRMAGYRVKFSARCDYQTPYTSDEAEMLGVVGRFTDDDGEYNHWIAAPGVEWVVEGYIPHSKSQWHSGWGFVAVLHLYLAKGSNGHVLLYGRKGDFRECIDDIRCYLSESVSHFEEQVRLSEMQQEKNPGKSRWRKLLGL